MKDDLVLLIDQAKAVLRGEQATLVGLLELAQKLKRKHAFDYARRVLEKALEQPDEDAVRRTTTIQQLALCTSKDPDLTHEERFGAALGILQPELTRVQAYLAATPECRPALAPGGVKTVQETFGIAGGIYKRRWHATGARSALLRSLQYYLAGYELGILADQGYTAINAAFVLDLVANRERREADGEAESLRHADERRQQARRIREQIIAALQPVPAAAEGAPAVSPPDDWWTLVTIGEAHFGLQQYEQARPLLSLAATKPVDPWEYEATVRQLADLARLTGEPALETADAEQSGPWKALEALVGPQRIRGLRSAFAGKLGLALSGGGFRASFFHIGVLAKLAELDLLRHVDVLSCVSGGSIVGAHYYLLIRKLLQEKPEDKISSDDYIALVDELEKKFTAFVQTNPRMRAFANPFRCLRSVMWGAWRPTAIAQVLEVGLYAPAAGMLDGEDSRKTRDVPLCELFIRPQGETEQFQPRQDNWRRAHKAPMLVLNATSLNSGHNWQFTASWFGEPVAGINAEVDGNERLRRMYYNEAPAAYRRLSLAQAASASAAVPGIFRSVTFKRLYEGGRVVRLVDGGVYDNQGTAALLDEGCTLLIVSDASGQLSAESNPSFRRWQTMFRSQSVFMGRIRGAEYEHLRSLVRSGQVRGLAFLHLKKDLESPPVDWIGCDNPKQPGHAGGAPLTSQRLTSYGIRADIQNLLSGIRTDLDAFCDAEAYALMASGYRMAAQTCGNEFARLAASPPEPAPAWRFLEIQPLMQQTQGAERFERVLKAGANLFFKCLLVWNVPKWAVFSGIALLACLFVSLVYLLIRVSHLKAGLLTAIIVFVLAAIAVWLFGLLAALSKLGDRIYLRYGGIAENVNQHNR